MQIEQGVTAAVVTGAASGLGRASAYALAGAGAKVAVFDINEDGGRAVADDITTGPRVIDLGVIGRSGSSPYAAQTSVSRTEAFERRST